MAGGEVRSGAVQPPNRGLHAQDKADGSLAAYLPQLPSFDVNTLTDTLSQVGASVTDGITSLATNITGWVADLASAFDAGWGEEEGEE